MRHHQISIHVFDKGRNMVSNDYMEPFTTVLSELSEKLILKIFEGCNNPLRRTRVKAYDNMKP